MIQIEIKDNDNYWDISELIAVKLMEKGFITFTGRWSMHRDLEKGI